MLYIDYKAELFWANMQISDHESLSYKYLTNRPVTTELYL